ncbi:MAG: CarD family transcriptional regulator [Candidatus Promineifilaceae bacterium]|jgi:RNA polymerase-interacting CarD/CdnL/TRCF family regulator
MKMDSSHVIGEGHWIAHAYYGIGRIMATETKCISGEDTQYFRVQTADSTYWVPTDQIDSEMLRPICSDDELRQAIEILQRPPQEMSSNHVARNNRIQRVTLQNSPNGVARLVRDLRARQRQKGALNLKESSAYKSLKKRLIDEWAVVKGINAEKAGQRLDDMLEECRLSAE